MKKLAKSLIFRKKLLLAVAASLLLIFSLIAIASGEIGSGPAIGSFSPAAGTNVATANPTISLVISDPDKINQSSIQVKLNGNVLPVQATFSQIGHYEDVYDSCTGQTYPQWVFDGYDYTKATITASAAAVPDQNAVTVSVSDQLGNTSTGDWKFTAIINPQIKILSPVNGSNVGPKPVISAQVTDNGGINPQSIIMRIGAQQVTPSFDKATGKVTFTPLTPLPGGKNDFYLEAADVYGNKSVVTWSANVSLDTAGPILSGFTPAEGTDIKSPGTQISFTASDPDKIDTNSVQVRVNGSLVTSIVTFATTGRLVQEWDSCTGNLIEYWVEAPDPTKATVTASVSNLPDVNTVSISINDQLGNPSSAQWKFSAMVPPVISDMIPGNGQYTSNSIPVISAKVTDLGAINPNSIVLRLNGEIVSHKYTSINASSGTVSYTPGTPLAIGTHGVTLDVKDTAGNNKTAAWTFSLVAGNAVFSDEFPAAGTILNTSNSAIKINVTDVVNLSSGSVSVSVNGKPVNASLSFKEIGHMTQEIDTCTGQPYDVWVVDGYDYKSGTVTAQASGLLNGKNTVSVTVNNAAGISTSRVWTFDVKIPPTLSQPAPAANSSVQVLTPVISAKAAYYGSIASFKMTLNGNEVPASFDAAAGSIKYTPAVSLANDTDYNVVVTVTDGEGNSANLSWKFHTQIYSDMQATGPCTNCHLGFPEPRHPMSNCAGCHSGGPIGDCADCHGGGEHSAGYLYGLNCNYCHNATYSYKIPLHPADITIYHNTTSNMEGCKQCHQTSLTIEHSRQKDSAGNPLTCYSCHLSSKPEVQAALTQKLRNCDACHGTTNHETVHTVIFTDTNCVDCHKDNLTTEHLQRKGTDGKLYTCATCHSSTNTRIRQAITEKTTACQACHIVAGHEAVHADSVLDDKCTKCHINSLTKEHLENEATQKNTLNCDTCHKNNGQAIARAINSSDKNCAACHQQGHNTIFGELPPSDIPLFEGFRWTVPADIKLWSGEAWVPAEYLEGGKVLISSRRSDITAAQVWPVYKNMTTNGWILSSNEPASTDSNFTAKFTKDSRMVTVWFYGGANPGDSTTVKGGNRIMIIYK